MSNEKQKEKLIIGFLKASLCLGGTERSAANISRLLAKDYNLYFILFNGSDIKYSYDGKLIDIKTPSRKSFLGKVANSFIRYKRVRKVVKQQNIDVLYEFLYIKNMLSYVSYKNVKRIISARDFREIQSKRKLYYYALSKANAMICNSEYIKNYYLSTYPQHKDKVFTVYNIIDGEEIACQSMEETEKEYIDFLNNHSKTISVVGRFCKEKGFEYMLEAFFKVTKNIDVGLVMVGDGGYKEKYQKIIQDLGIEDRVYFTGFQNNPYKYMAKSDIFVLSSLSEGFPNVLGEAMSLGLPVIATNCYSGPAEILREDCDYGAVTDKFVECDYGIITPRMTKENNQNAIEELSKALEYLLKDGNLMQKYAKLAKQRAEKYSASAAAEKFNGIFEMLREGKL